MDMQSIISEIERLTRGQYEEWTIGVTDNPDRRRAEHEEEDDDDGKRTSRWRDWYADTEDDARDVEEYFIDKGMQGGTGGQGQADFVYIF